MPAGRAGLKQTSCLLMMATRLVKCVLTCFQKTCFILREKHYTTVAGDCAFFLVAFGDSAGGTLKWIEYFPSKLQQTIAEKARFGVGVHQCWPALRFGVALVAKL